ncbi:MAG: hypothetical protein Tsb002_11000 [Wenzhouxiangellaceae bacterium]
MAPLAGGAGDRPTGHSLITQGSLQLQSDQLAPTAPALGTGVQCFDVSAIESVDVLDDSDNFQIDLHVGPGNTVTGIAWDVMISTIGASWLSEASIQISDTTGSADPNALVLAPGSGQDLPGMETFSSNGVVVLADNGANDIVVGNDGLLRLQFFESFDDVPDTTDAIWDNSATPVVCGGLFLQCTDQINCMWGVVDLEAPALIPTLNPFGLVLLIAGLWLLALFRRQVLRQ